MLVSIVALSDVWCPGPSDWRSRFTQPSFGKSARSVRLADIESLDNLEELSELLGDVLCKRSATEISLRLNSGFRVVLVSAHPARAGAAPKGPDWKNTTRMKIMDIEPING